MQKNQMEAALASTDTAMYSQLNVLKTVWMAKKITSWHHSRIPGKWQPVCKYLIYDVYFLPVDIQHTQCNTQCARRFFFLEIYYAYTYSS